jgi:hypothetical protein
VGEGSNEPRRGRASCGRDKSKGDSPEVTNFDGGRCREGGIGGSNGEVEKRKGLGSWEAGRGLGMWRLRCTMASGCGLGGRWLWI